MELSFQEFVKRCSKRVLLWFIALDRREGMHVYEAGSGLVYRPARSGKTKEW
jgi:hypothetical protein